MRRPYPNTPEATPVAFGTMVLQRLSEVGVDRGDEFDVIKVVPDGPAPASVDENMLGGFAGESDTSREAAIDHYPKSGTLRRKVLEAIGAAGENGATSDELAALRGWRLYSVKPRMTELRRGGWIERHGTRPSTTKSGVDVYVLTVKGRQELDEPGSTAS